MKVKILSLLLMTGLFSMNAEAGRDRAREVRQQGRIAEGVKSGELTRPEARRLHRGQKRVDAAQQAANADGVVTPEEKAKLEKMQDVQSKRIYQQKHDDQKRPEETHE